MAALNGQRDNTMTVHIQNPAIYYHNSGKAGGEWRPFTEEQCRVIDQAWHAKQSTVMLPHMPNNPEGNRDFEIRFGRAATSKKLDKVPGIPEI